MAISTYLSIITLNVNGLNTPIKRHNGRKPQLNGSLQSRVYILRGVV